MRLFSDYTPVVQQISVDEAFLDMTGTERLLGTPESIAKRLKHQVKSDMGLTISVGIASNRYLSKLASAHKKPDGLCLIPEGEEASFMRTLELKNIWGIGEKTLLRLAELNITSMKDLLRHEEASLKLMLGNAGGGFLYRAARGIDPGIFAAENRSRSISAETTFERDTADRELISRTILDLSHQTMFRLIDGSFRATTVNLKLRYSDFTTTTIQKTLRHAIGSAEEIHLIAMELLGRRWDGASAVRLLGIGLSSIEAIQEGMQQDLFEDEFSRKKKVEQAVLLMKQKGKVKMTKASLLSGLKRRPE